MTPFERTLRADAAAMRAAMPRVVRPDPEALPATLVAELEKLTDAQKFKLLGELLEPSIACTFEFASDDLSDAMLPIVDAYQDVYDECQAIVDYDLGERHP